jgi:exopolysaccharide biosynthesis polyprenyl glycosylphosphotransferase
VGAGQVGRRIERRLQEHPEIGLKPIGFVDSPGAANGSGVPVLGGPSRLRSVIQETGAEHVIFAFLPIPDSDLLPLVRQCEALGVGISVVPRLFETTTSHYELNHIGGLPLFAFRRIDPQGWQFALKHVFDRVAAALLALLLSPLLLAIAIAVKLTSPGPVLFRQARAGRDGAEFDILKFRTMHLPLRPSSFDAPRPVEDLAPGGVEGEDRRTRVGSVLRRTSLDELPQLFNVLRGDMSIVGPRPERPEYVRLFTDNVMSYGDRHRVKSGITGWAQVHGLRGRTSLSDRVEWDNYYIENWSLWLDLKILLMTLVASVRGE